MEVGSQANERVAEAGVQALDEEGILVKIGGQGNDTSFTYSASSRKI